MRNHLAIGAVALLLVLLPLIACSTGQRVPDIKGDQINAVSFRAINPRNLKIDVRNLRKLNQQAGNSVEVEKAVYHAISDATMRGGLTTRDTSKNRLAVQILDYDGANAQGECVKLNATLTAKWGSSLYAESYACHYLKHFIGIQLGGDISEAYASAINMLLQSLDSKQMELLGH